MANIYVRSGAGGAGTGADWANAFTTLTASLVGAAAGDALWVSEDHAESTAGAVTLTSPGTISNPCFFYCVDHTGTVPPVSADLRTTATVTTTGNNAMTLAGSGYYYGIIFNAGSGAVAAKLTGTGAWQKFSACSLRKLGTTGTGGAISFTTAGQITELVNTTIQIGSTSDTLRPAAGLFTWRDTASAIVGATIPNSLFGLNAATNLLVDGVDLSALGSGKTLISPSGVSSGMNAVLNRCKLGSSVTLCGAFTHPRQQADFIQCDSGATNYFDSRRTYEGTQDQETTIVRTSGATDGTTVIAWKIVSTASTRWVLPFESQPITIWNDSTSAITTLTIYGTTTGGGVPNNDDIWVLVEYLGSSSSPQASFIATTKANNLAAVATTNNSSDGSTWGGGGAGNGFKIVVPSFTPGMKGPINITIKVAKASTTYYIDPLPSISGVTVSKSAILAPGVYANELSSGSSGMKYRALMRGNVG